MPQTDHSTDLLNRAVALYQVAFEEEAAKHGASSYKVHKQHDIFLPLLGVAINKIYQQGLCAGLSCLWIYYQNFFQDGIYALKPVHLFDVFTPEYLTKKTRIASVRSADDVGVVLSRFKEQAAKDPEVSMFAQCLEEEHKASSAANKAQLDARLERFACKFESEKTFPWPFRNMGSFMKKRAFYYVSSGSHAMAVSTYGTGKKTLQFYDPNVGQVDFASTSAADKFFTAYLPRLYNTSSKVVNDRVLTLPEQKTKALVVRRYYSTRKK